MIADVLGHTVTEIQTRAIGNSGGHVRFDPAEGLSRADEHWHNLLILFAPIGLNQGCAQGDDVRAFSHLTQIIGAGEKPTGYDGMLTLSVLHRAAIARARELVDEHRVAIILLTGVLLEERNLAGDRLAETMRKIHNTPSAEELIARGRAGSVDSGVRDER
ncbi:hypothetical protein AB3K78_01210 [Leucobacter sp. HNU]|uniref:hypothetical protein n=1 Tax=Leucobacter sp. HNU TaxID=3236805 RepID=UPI003A7F93E8